MSMFDRLLKHLDDRGLRVEAGDEPGQLLLRGPIAEKTPEVLRAVKAFKPQLLERVGRRPAPGSAARSPRAAEREGEGATLPVLNVPDGDGLRCGACNRVWFCSEEEVRSCVQSPAVCDRPAPQRPTPATGTTPPSPSCPWKT